MFVHAKMHAVLTVVHSGHFEMLPNNCRRLSWARFCGDDNSGIDGNRDYVARGDNDCTLPLRVRQEVACRSLECHALQLYRRGFVFISGALPFEHTSCSEINLPSDCATRAT